MPTIYEIKEREVLDTPILLMECRLHDGTVERWSSHELSVEGASFSGRVLAHDLFSFRMGTDEGVDGASRISLQLANADSRFSQIERNVGLKGARLKVEFAFFDLASGSILTERQTVFRGVCTGVEEITEEACKVSFSNLLNLQRIVFPTRRIQRTCPWVFPETEQQRIEASTGGIHGKYSLYFPCGYSPDVPGGVGNVGVDGPFTNCSYTRAACQERGMLRQDDAEQPTRRFGGIGFVPATTLVRSFGEKDFKAGAVLGNETKYNEAVPVIYGSGWYSPPIVFSRNDGNLTRLEVLLGAGEMERVHKVIVNQIEIPESEAGKDMTGTGWYTLLHSGGRTGNFNGEYLDADGEPMGDPYGSTAYLSVVVPNAIGGGARLPRIDVLVDGLRLPRYNLDGSYLGEFFTANPAWVMLDILRRSGWSLSDLNVVSFAKVASYCDELISTVDEDGEEILLPRFRCNLPLTKRRSVAEIIRGVKSAAGLYFVYGADGRVELRAEGTIADQQAEKPEGSNSTTTLNGGWPAYEFGDGAYGFSGICRRANGKPSLRLWSKPAGEVANRCSVEYQDAYNLYQQAAVSVVDLEDVKRLGYEVSGTFPVLGLPNAHQATRVLRRHLDKSIRGNLFVEFQTSVRGLGIRPGDVITLTYAKDGLDRAPFRVLKIAPDLNYRTLTITAQLHDDSWYSDEAGALAKGYRVGVGGGVPRPLAGAVVDADGFSRLEIAEESELLTDGVALIRLSAAFSPPARPTATAPPPIVGLSPEVWDTGGGLAGGRSYYYAVTGVDAVGNETGSSAFVRAVVPDGTNTNRVVLTGLKASAGIVSYRVYRGPTPSHLLRVADAVAATETFEDVGSTPEAIPVPDHNYDTANFYWRYELMPPVAASIVGSLSVGNADLSLLPDEFVGKRIVITEGDGRGQERTIASNTASTLTISEPWAVLPSSISKFAIAESNWQMATSSKTSPAWITAPNRKDMVIHIAGRARNAVGVESSAELAVMARWRIGGSSGTLVDAEPPPEPFFSLATTGQGGVEVVGVSFADLTNTRTVEAATLSIFYWEELSAPNQSTLLSGSSDSDTTIALDGAGPALPGDLIQMGAEILTVEETFSAGTVYQVQRGRYGTAPFSHAAGTDVFHLRKRTYVLGFPTDFFGSPASGSYSYSIPLPDVRIAGAEMYVTNVKGTSPTTRVSYTGTVDYGLRTHSGGQLTLQSEGFLAIQSDVCPPLVISNSHSVRDVFARVADAPVGEDVVLRIHLDGTEYCPLTIPAGSNVSNVVNGFNLRPLEAGSVLTLEIVSLGQVFGTMPGRNLTVTIRL